MLIEAGASKITSYTLFVSRQSLHSLDFINDITFAFGLFKAEDLALGIGMVSLSVTSIWRRMTTSTLKQSLLSRPIRHGRHDQLKVINTAEL